MSGIAQMLKEQAKQEKDRQSINALRTQLLALDRKAEHLAEKATLLVSHFFINRWTQLPTHSRKALEQRAALSLGDLEALLTPKQLHNAIEERTRAMLREDFPYLSAATILAQVEE